MAESGDPGPVPNKRTHTQVAATDLMGGSNTVIDEKHQKQSKIMATEAGEGSGAGAPNTNTPPSKDKTYRTAGGRRISKLAAKDPRKNLPTVVKPKDPYTAENVSSSKHKALVRNAARSTVGVFCTAQDRNVIRQFTGIVISWKETRKQARILTSSDIVSEFDPNKLKLYICLPNRTVLEGQLLFFNEHYEIALLEISSESDLRLQIPSFGSSPNYGQEVFILARSKESSLMARHGTILWREDPEYFGRNYLMFLSCEPPRAASGGPVIDHDGNVIAMAFDNGGSNTSILAISAILTCNEMWMKSRTVELLEVSLQEMISFDHNVNNGYIVDEVSFDSTTEKLGIRYGDVIVSFDGLHAHTLPQLEDYLLSLGWGFLEGSTDSRSNIDLKLVMLRSEKHTQRTYCVTMLRTRMVMEDKTRCFLFPPFLSGNVWIQICMEDKMERSLFPPFLSDHTILYFGRIGGNAWINIRSLFIFGNVLIRIYVNVWTRVLACSCR